MKDLAAGPVLVYVASTGRSGSTLLEMLLASHPAITTVGELIVLPHLLADPAGACGCGRLLEDCPFWSRLLADGVITRPLPPDPFREQRFAGRVIRPRLTVEILTGTVGRRTHQHASSYGALTTRIIRLLATRREAALVVDSSKDPYRLHLLRAAGLDVRVVLLVRDPRGFVFSMGSAEKSGGSWRRLVRRAIRWNVQNLLFEAQRRRPIDHRHDTTLVLRYEDLAARPDDVLAVLGTWLGIDPAGFDAQHFRDARNHPLAGNPMRDRADGVQIDLRWRSEMAPRQGRVAWALTALVARHFGYRRR